MSAPSAMIQAMETGFAGLRVLKPGPIPDHRGVFVKTYHAGWFHDLGVPFVPREEFYSNSAKDVLRGMHFQLPPAAHAKVIYCLRGRVLDVVLDLRRASATFGRAFSRELSAANRELLYVPAGFAHGFLALADDSLMVYKMDAVHSPAHDVGIAWNSFGFPWPVAHPVLSDRDRQFPAWADFESPF